MILPDNVDRLAGLDSDKLGQVVVLCDKREMVDPDTDILYDNDVAVPDTVVWGHLTTRPPAFDSPKRDSDNIKCL